MGKPLWFKTSCLEKIFIIFSISQFDLHENTHLSHRTTSLIKQLDNNYNDDNDIDNKKDNDNTF